MTLRRFGTNFFHPVFLLIALSTGRPLMAAATSPVATALGPLPLVEIELADDAIAARLAELGLDVIEIHPGRTARVLAWPGDALIMTRAGLPWRVIDPDYGRSLARAAEADAGRPEADTGRMDHTIGRDRLTPLAIPPPGSGSFGGWYSLAEVYAVMDSLVVTYPTLCDTLRIGTSRQARPIRAFRITDESQPAQSRPRVLYTSLTHAREPGGMQALLAFMSRLIEGYGVDPNLTCLVNSRELWFVPVVNPDGYEYNRQTWVSTGAFGLWRKNLRDNNGDFTITSADGVDLNRNFGFRWGHDNIGSSPTASSQTYRGPSSFSEPETRALRDFANARGFTTADNYHTYAEICIYPWGYIAPACPDSTFLTRMAEEMQAEAGYAYGTPGDLLYTVNGDANDWMYGEQVTKPKILPVTIEAGDDNDGFWPPASRIVPLAREQHRANVVLAYAAGTWVHADTARIVTDDSSWHPGNWADIRVRLRNDGVLASTGAVTATASTGVPGITVQDASCQWPVIPPGGNLDPDDPADFFRLLASPSVLPGTRVPVVLDIIDQGSYVHRDTIEVTVGTPLVVMSSDGASMAGWTPTGTWGIQVIAGNAVLSDSPSGKYANGATTTLTRTADLDLSGGTNPVLTFRTLYDFERGFDAGRVEVSTNGGASWTILRGRLGRPGKGSGGAYGGSTQELEKSIYDGTQRIWGDELIDLSAYQGLTNIRLRFRLTSDSSLNRDGWKIDDVAVRIYPIDVAGVADGQLPGQPGVVPGLIDGEGAGPHLAAIHPNPVGRSGARIMAEFPTSSAYRLVVYDIQGRLVEIVSEGISAAGTREFLWRGAGAGASGGGSPSGGGG
ncbi:MAG: M14 family zinc carboxypeptidase, partial [Candidatus Eisenbacteria bacterium]|nr:M14 family zinc carboxypeptidase [Candidatus Eisenbacteria bacterium]